MHKRQKQSLKCLCTLQTYEIHSLSVSLVRASHTQRFIVLTCVSAMKISVCINTWRYLHISVSKVHISCSFCVDVHRKAAFQVTTHGLRLLNITAMKEQVRCVASNGWLKLFWLGKVVMSTDSLRVAVVIMLSCNFFLIVLFFGYCTGAKEINEIIFFSSFVFSQSPRKMTQICN